MEEVEVEANTSINAVSLTETLYSPYGNVIEAKVSGSEPANFGTAQRFNWLSDLTNLRPESAKANVCVFRSVPRQLPFEIKLLEKHPFSTQMFIPMTAQKRYLVIVANGDDKPDLSTLKAFVADRSQGISYYPGVWHHPMIALDNVTDFACIVYEDKTEGDCVVKKFSKSILCHVPN